MKPKKFDVSIIVPAYNEKAVIGDTLQKLTGYVAKNHTELGDCEVIVVAAGTDRTPAIARKFAKDFASLQIITPKGRVGKGRDVRLGMQAAKGDIQLFMDADLSTPLHHIGPMVQRLRDGYDVVVGARRLSKIHEGTMRSLLSVCSNLAIRVMLLPRYRDTQCGFKGFTAHASRLLFENQEIKGWGFDLEILQYAKEARLKVKQLPISDWHEARGEDLRGERLGSAALTTLKDLTKLRLAAWARSVKRHWLIWIVLSMAAVFGLAMWLGMQQSVWFDEAYSITLAKQSYGNLVHSTAIDVHPPLYYIVLKAWSQLFGMGEFALRSLSALLAALAAGAGLVFARRVFGLRAMATATPLLVLSPLLVRYAFELRMYTLASLITVAGTYVLARATQATNHKLRWWIGYSVLVALGMYTLYYMAFVWIAHALWLLYRYFATRPRTSLLKQPWIWALAGAVALYTPWLPSFIEQQKDPALSGIAQRVSWQQIADVFSFLFTYQPHWSLNGWSCALIIGATGGTVYIVARAIRQAGELRPYLLLLLACFAVPIVLMAVGSIPPLRPLFLIRYISHFAIVVPLLIGASLAVAFRNKTRYAVIGVAMLTGILVYGICNLQKQGNFVFDMLSRPQARQAVQAAGQCVDDSIVMAGSPLIYFELDYYMPGCDIYFYSTHPIAAKGGYASIYQSPKQYYSGDPLPANTIYMIYAGQHPELPGNYVKTSSQEFQNYRLDIYKKQ